MVMLALLNLKLFFMKDQESEMDSMLKEDLEEISDHDLEGAVFTIEGRHEPAQPCVGEPWMRDSLATKEDESFKISNTNIQKRLRYYKTLFY